MTQATKKAAAGGGVSVAPAAVFGQMERLAELSQLQRSLSRGPKQRTEPDIARVQHETSHVAALQTHGAHVHHDLCYVLQSLKLEKGETRSFKELPGAGEALFMVLSGSVTVYTADPSPFDPILASGKVVTRDKKEMSEETLMELFKDLDEDRSGSIDSMELMHALEMLGMDIEWSAMEEAINSVDADGSGQLEFEEFKMVMEEKLGFKKKGQHGWHAYEGREGIRQRFFYEGDVFGEAALLSGLRLGGTMSTEALDPLVAVLTRANFEHILANGFSGDLQKKLDRLKGQQLVQQMLRTTDLKQVAYSGVIESFSAKATVHRQGDRPEGMIFLLEGELKLVKAGSQPHSHSPRASLHTPSTLPGGRSPRGATEVARLNAFDILSEAALAVKDRSYRLPYTAVAVSRVLLLRLPLKAMESVVASSDMHQLVEHAELRMSWRERRAGAARDTMSSVEGRTAETVLVHRANSTVQAAKDGASHHRQARSPSRGAAVTEPDALQGVTLASAKTLPRLWDGTTQWIPTGALTTKEEKECRENATTATASEARGDMLQSLHMVAAGRPILSRSLLEAPEDAGGWQDVQTNVALSIEAAMRQPDQPGSPVSASLTAVTKGFSLDTTRRFSPPQITGTQRVHLEAAECWDWASSPMRHTLPDRAVNIHRTSGTDTIGSRVKAAHHGTRSSLIRAPPGTINRKPRVPVSACWQPPPETFGEYLTRRMTEAAAQKQQYTSDTSQTVSGDGRGTTTGLEGSVGPSTIRARTPSPARSSSPGRPGRAPPSQAAAMGFRASRSIAMHERLQKAKANSRQSSASASPFTMLTETRSGRGLSATASGSAALFASVATTAGSDRRRPATVGSLPMQGTQRPGSSLQADFYENQWTGPGALRSSWTGGNVWPNSANSAGRRMTSATKMLVADMLPRESQQPGSDNDALRRGAVSARGPRGRPA